MNRIFKIFLISVVVLLSNLYTASAQTNLELNLFYSKDCPHCEKERSFLNLLRDKYPTIKINEYEITTNKENLELFEKVGKELNTTTAYVPFLVINDKVITGYLSDTTTGKEIEQYVKNSINSTTEITTLNDTNVIKLPLFGLINTREISLPGLAVVLGFVDGFNPCAMWTLLFLISILLNIKNRKRMWILGITFIVTSGIVYGLFMSAWLNVFLFLGYLPVIKLIIGITAVIFGTLHIKKYFKSDTGCSTTNSEKRQQFLNKLKEIVYRENFLLALIGMVLLAISVNFIEMMCSVGLPAIYTNLLSTNNLAPLQYFIYISIYILFFMIDDIIVFVTAMITLHAIGIENKYAKYSNLIGGIIILIIGILMLFKPELLTFK